MGETHVSSRSEHRIKKFLENRNLTHVRVSSDHFEINHSPKVQHKREELSNTYVEEMIEEQRVVV